MTSRKPATGPISLGEHLLELADQLRRTFTAAVGTEGLTYMEGRVLRIALRESQQAAIIDAVHIAPSSVSAILTKLEGMELLTRVSSRGDRRHRSVVLTPKGVALLRRVFERLDGASPLMTELDASERSQMRDLVMKVLAADASVNRD